MKEKKLFPLIAVICLIVIAIIGLILKDKKLDLKSELVTNLYSYLGEVDIYHCGGLKAYSASSITIDDLNKDNLLCMAYYNLSESKIKQNESSETEKNANSQDVCRVGEGINILANEDSKTCTYKTLNTSDLNTEYKKMYGTNISNYNSFYISSNEKCSLDGETYYCGLAETYNFSMGAEATIYRLLNKAIKKFDGDIIIYDYFLKVSDSICYKTTTNDDKDDNCTTNISDSIDETFIQKYGTLYKHTYKKDSDGNYYWSKSEMQ